MMKTRNINLLLTALMMVVLQSCYGNKDGDITDNLPQVVGVKGISSDTYTLYQGDKFTLTPEIRLSEGADSMAYDYRWIVGKGEVIGTQRYLDWAVSLPSGYSMANNVPGTFVVHNKENGLEFRQTFTFKVLSSYTPNYVCVYEKAGGAIEWMALQGEPTAFSRHFDDMIARISPKEPLTGKFSGALLSGSELAIFTNHRPDYGRCLSIRNASAEDNFLFNVGEYTGEVGNKMYKGTAPAIDIHNAVFGYGASKYFICNGTLHVFNGTDSKLPVFDEQTWVKSQGVKQAMSSKQFQRYKKATFVLHDDGRVGCYHVYNDEMEYIKADGQDFRLDELVGCFSEATGKSANQSYRIYLIGKKNGQYKMYRFYVNYLKRVVQPLKLEQTMDLDATFARSVGYWWGSFGQRYGFFTRANSIYRFDYYEMNQFDTDKAQQLITFPDEEEIIDVVPLVKGSGLRDEDFCTVVMLYNKAQQRSSLYVYDTATGKKIQSYDHIIPGRALYFAKCL